MKSKVYDCFSFLNELDLLEIRLNILDEYVDKFVITEAKEGHSGKKKEANLFHNMERFSKFKDKIIYQVIEKFPDLPSHLKHRFQVNYALNVTKNLDENVLIMSGDIDEIPNPEILEKSLRLASEGKFIVFEQKMCYYYLNVQTEDLHSVAGEKENWLGTRLCKNKLLLKNVLTIDDLRLPHPTSHGLVVKNGGWHFSHQGGLDKITEKIESSLHQEFNNQFIKNNITNAIANFDAGTDLYFRKAKFKIVKLDNYPEYIVKNKEKYNHMLKEWENE